MVLKSNDVEKLFTLNNHNINVRQKQQTSMLCRYDYGSYKMFCTICNEMKWNQLNFFFKCASADYYFLF